MNDEKSNYRILFAGGGTGGHLFPAIAVAQQIRELKPEADILFIGTKSKLEGKMVPKLGFKFKSIWIKGIARKFSFENLLFPLKLLVSTIQSLIINIKFKPKVAIGSGGYVSGPSIWAANVMGAKIILLEQNSYPGLTTKLLEKYADEVHLSFDSSRKYLKKEKILFTTGNPVRKNLGSINKNDAVKLFGLDEALKTILVLGGSLGAYSINHSFAKIVKQLSDEGLQIIWQTGKNYFDQYKQLKSRSVKVLDFIEDINAAYSASELVIARAGATTIAELLVLGKPSILIPSPNVSENHQYHNARALADKSASVLLEDKQLEEKLFETITGTISDSKKLDELSKNALLLARPDAVKVIARNAIKYCESI
jgi:UDP-N-acetylglucosamine--N-acetylmuramyl-(pentapeptide) pyrophosphoryl-undecaprenol N-acetylglucosamine transferase